MMSRSRSGASRSSSSNAVRDAEIKKQMHIYRENLHCVCRLAIRSMVEKASCEGVDDSCHEFKNLATILEHILSHRLKGQVTWFGLEGPKEFWDFIVAACSSLPHNSISTISGMEDAKTHKAKGRAWIRSVLMEKRLGEYMSHALSDSRAIRAFYGEGAYMRSQESKELVQELQKLNTVDFSSCLKGERLETGVASVIDYSVYLKEQLSKYDMQEASKTHQPITDATLTSPEASNNHVDITDKEQTTQSRLSRLQDQYRIVCAQKNYLEEMLAHKEKGIGDALQEIQRYQQTMKVLEQQARQDRQHWEKVVLDLQDQIASLKEAQMVSRRELEEHLISSGVGLSRMSSVSTYTDPEIALDKLENMVLEVMPDNDSIQSTGELSPDGNTSVDSPENSSITSSIRTDDQRSEDRYASAGSLQVSQKLEKEQTPSLVPLAGSFSSQMSLRSSETNWSSSANIGDTTPYSQTQALLQDGASVSSESGVSTGEGQSVSGNTFPPY